ncbi:hypothetical protein BCR22_10055 [Enterococcus plantarum]|uniref:DUF916 and DUF3324 domain-containing protein n=1 Tax=Enterococcus plantarum TaxID=1077675 RepID=UPI00084CF3D8|nr:DUF916 and DUF3324 domain-containing protein [Enterococcus plantarum]OEG19063.1 hypothetical protein BCR22_10055 [Enterococcus plantarum]
MNAKSLSHSLLFLLASLFLLLMFPNTASAQETAYYLKPLIPENQIENTEDYFNIATSSAIDQTLELLIVNESAEEKEMNVTILDGMTTKDGAISYAVDHKYDPAQQYKLSQIAKVEQQEITVEANSTQLVSVVLKAELKNFDGTILGAVNVSEKTTEQPNEGINNTFAYNIPIKIRVNKETKNSQMNYKGINLVNNKPERFIDVSFQNPIPTIIRDLTLSFEIYKKGQPTKILFKNSMTGIEIAPNSLFSPELSLTNSKLKAGNYVLKTTGKSEGINEVWESDFTISQSDSRTINEGLDVLNEDNRAWLILASIVALLILGGFGYVFYKRKK